MLEPPTEKPRDSGVDRAAIPAVITRAQKIRAEFYDQAGRQTLPSCLWTQGSDTGAALSPILQKYIASVVEVLHDDRRVAYGTVVADGIVVTKASEIPAVPRCRLATGDVRNAKSLRTDATMDLAILEVDTNGLRPVVFAQGEIPVGKIVLTPDLAGRLLGLGIVSVARRNRDGPFPVKVTPAPPRGEPVLEVPEIVGRKLDDDYFLITHVGPAVAAADVHVGDLVVEVDRRPYAAAPGQTTLAASVRKQAPGDTRTLSLLRNGARIERQLVLYERPYTQCSKSPGPYVSYRWNDFPVVFEHDIPLALDECGGPVVDLDGNVIGITIARVGPHGCSALPFDMVRSFVAGN
jgi:S1-C subfamily serine protease